MRAPVTSVALMYHKDRFLTSFIGCYGTGFLRNHFGCIRSAHGLSMVNITNIMVLCVLLKLCAVSDVDAERMHQNVALQAVL